MNVGCESIMLTYVCIKLFIVRGKARVKRDGLESGVCELTPLTAMV